MWAGLGTTLRWEVSTFSWLIINKGGDRVSKPSGNLCSLHNVLWWIQDAFSIGRWAKNWMPACQVKVHSHPASGIYINELLTAFIIFSFPVEVVEGWERIAIWIFWSKLWRHGEHGERQLVGPARLHHVLHQLRCWPGQYLAIPLSLLQEWRR